jgi:O-antigen ligase
MNMTKKHIKEITNWFEKAVEYLVYASLVLVPLVFLPFVNSVFTTPKLYIFRIITLLIVFLWTLKFVFKKENSLRKTVFGWFLLAYALISIITTIFSVNIYSSIIGTYGRFIGLITVLNLIFWAYIVIAAMRDRAKIKKAMWASVITAFFVAIYGICQYFGFFADIFNWSQDPTLRMFSTIGHSNHVAAYLGMNLMLLIGICSTAKFSWRKIFLYVTGFLFFFAIVFTASRGGIAATVIALIIWAVFVLKEKGLRNYFKKYGKVILFMIAVFFLAVIVFRQPLADLKIVERTQSTIEFIQKGNVPDRVSWWMSSFEMIKDKPFIGHGLSAYRDIYNQYRRADYRLPENAQDNITPQSAHNEYLTIWSQQGTLGLLIYLSMIGFVVYRALKFVKNEKDVNSRVTAFALFTAVIVYLLQVFLSFGVISTLFLFYTLLGLLIAFVENEKKNRYARFKLPLILRGIIAAFLIVLISVGCVFTLRFLAADYHYKIAKGYFAAADYKQSIEEYENAEYYMPYIAEYYEGHADFVFNLGIKMPESSQEVYMLDALSLYYKAKEITPTIPYLNANIALTASRLAVLNEGTEKEELYQKYTLDHIENAVKYSRNNPLYHYKYGKYLLFFDKPEEAYTQFEKVLELRLDYKDTNELINQAQNFIGDPSEEETLQTQ